MEADAFEWLEAEIQNENHINPEKILYYFVGEQHYGKSLSTVKEALSKRQWKETRNPCQASLIWTMSHDWQPPKNFQALTEKHHVKPILNHFTHVLEVSTKLSLHNRLRTYQTFYPRSYVLFEDTEVFLQDFRSEKKRQSIDGGDNLWIIKPVDQACGRGIKLFRSADELLLHCQQHQEYQYIAQKYIENPHLVMKKKYEIRVYVLATRLDHTFAIYMYNLPIILLCCEDYASENLNEFAHITNYAIQRNHPDFSAISPENKILLEDYKKILASEGYSERIYDDHIQPAMERAISATFHSWASESSDNRCFELFGIDFILDSLLNPWLVDVSYSPSLHPPHPLKIAMISDLLNVVLDGTAENTLWKSLDNINKNNK